MVSRDDILVAGAGPAGASIARLLALHGKRVTLVDPQTRCTDRLEIVAPAGCPALAALGMMHLLQDTAIARPCLGIRRRWSAAGTEIEDFMRRPGGSGFVIDRAAFDGALRAAATEAGVAMLPGRVVAVRRARGAMSVTIATSSNARVISAGLVIDATGRPAAVARRLGAYRLAVDPLVAERRLSARAAAPCHDAGWLTVAGRRHVWSYQVRGPDGRRERWAVYRPDKRAHPDTRMRVDASSALLSSAAGDGWIAIGDAAASFDPVTSQGLANALSTALVAAGAIASPRGLDDEACSVYSDAVRATFHHSEIGRRSVYGALAK